ncbi:type VII secretion system-associated protein [Saccharopolyspora shandongensis]|uniref:type VII secretion system-associated protein n=1 Tax=Saccharopolyspora shandongensis TaxID=418495 RepID=UPI0033E3BEBE
MTTPGNDDHKDDQPAEDQWVFLIDPAWQAQFAENAPDDDATDEESDGPAEQEVQGPPLEAVVGGWLVTADGTVGRFRANPDYVPSQPGSPTDPVDATLQLLVRGEIDSDALFAVLKESVFDVALDAAGRPIIAPSPDDVPSLLVATAPAQRHRVHADDWRAEVTAAELSDLLQEHQVDVLFNPGAPASIRLVGEMFTEYVTAE